jgi:hypothetical protein
VSIALLRKEAQILPVKEQLTYRHKLCMRRQEVLEPSHREEDEAAVFLAKHWLTPCLSSELQLRVECRSLTLTTVRWSAHFPPMLGMQSSASHMLGKHSTTVLHSWPLEDSLFKPIAQCAIPREMLIWNLNSEASGSG